jgi:hypothetical protein
VTSPLDRVLDLVFYAPLGLAVRAAEEVPKLAAQGRERMRLQAPVARMVGKMAVAQGRRQVQDILDRRPTDRPAEPPVGSNGAAATSASAGRDVPIRDLGPDEDLLPVPAPETAPAADCPVDLVPPAGAASASTGDTPSAADLPIPGYDSLSASQVVQRLPGLSHEELERVRAYEQAGRGRKTVLLRVAQLRAAS